MRILRIADVPNNRTGGMSRFMHFITDELRALGHEVDMLFNTDLGGPGTSRLRRFITPFRVMQAVNRRRALGRKYDAVEIHEPVAAAYCLARRMNGSLPPAVVVSYGLEGRCQEAMLRYYAKKGVPVSLKRRYSPYSVIAQANLALSLADHVTVETTEDREHLLTRFKLDSSRVTIVNGGVTPTFLTAPPRPVTANGILFLATWIDRKGIRDVVPAVSRLLERHPCTPVTIAGFGCTPEEVQGAFPSPVRKRLRLVQRVEGEEALLRLYQEHSVFLTPSVFEGQLLTMQEAAAAGSAVVGTRCCGMRDFLRDGTTGLLVEAGDIDNLTAAITRLVEDPTLAARLGAAAQEDARRYTWKRSSEQFMAAVTAVAGHQRPGGKRCAS